MYKNVLRKTTERSLLFDVSSEGLSLAPYPKRFMLDQ